MPEITLPDMSYLWAEGGDVLKPSDSKVQQGWQVEIPPRQWFNWLDNRQDQAIAHIAQHGISVWSAETEYQAGKSYVQGSDGLVYKALTTQRNNNPVGGAVGNWESAFLTAAQATQVASAAQSRAMTANNVYLSPLQLANAFTGTNQNTAASGFQVLPGGVTLQWGTINTNGQGVAATFARPFTTRTFAVVANCRDSTQGTDAVEIVNITLTGFTAATATGPNTATFFAIGI